MCQGILPHLVKMTILVLVDYILWLKSPWESLVPFDPHTLRDGMIRTFELMKNCSDLPRVTELCMRKPDTNHIASVI